MLHKNIGDRARPKFCSLGLGLGIEALVSGLLLFSRPLNN